jgi:hypothetical protein
MEQRQRQIGYDWVLYSHMRENALVGWIYIRAGEVWHSHK